MYADNPGSGTRTPNELAATALMAETAFRNIPVDNSFSNFANHPQVLNRIRRTYGYVPEKPPAELVLEYRLLRWVKAGLSTIRLTEDLSAALALTDVNDVPFEDWKWPFSTFVIHVPYGFWVTNTPLGKDSVVMILATKSLSSDGGLMGQQIMFGRDGSATFSQVPLEGFDTIGDWFSAVEEINRDQTSISDTYELDATDQQNMNEGWKLVVNTCLYMTERRGVHVVKHTTKSARKRADKKGLSTGGPDVWILGQEVKLDRRVIEAAKTRAIGGPAWRVNAQFVVHGHWRNQAYGPGYSLHREKFIEPYFKGQGKRFAHIYDPSDDNEE